MCQNRVQAENEPKIVNSSHPLNIVLLGPYNELMQQCGKVDWRKGALEMYEEMKVRSIAKKVLGSLQTANPNP